MLWFLACHGASDSAANSHTGGVEIFDRPAPTWSATEVEQKMVAVLDLGLPTPDALLSAYRELLAQGAGPTCPERNGENLTAYMGCSENGWSWGGITEISDQPEMLMMVADFYAINPTGDLFTGGGRVVAMSGGSPTEGVSFSVAGTWGYPPAGGWLGQGISTSMAMSQSATGTAFQLEGSYGVGDSYMTFEHVAVGVSDCPSGMGAFHVRDPSGYWYDVQFTDACDGCVEVFWGEERLGESCGALSATLTTGLQAAMGGA